MKIIIGDFEISFKGISHGRQSFWIRRNDDGFVGEGIEISIATLNKWFHNFWDKEF